MDEGTKGKRPGVAAAGPLTRVSGLCARWPEVSREDLERVAAVYPFRVTNHCLGLMEGPDDPVWRQFVPDPAELHDPGGLADPLAEESLSPVPNLVHRYPDRVLWLVSGRCAANCRFCTRKRRLASPLALSRDMEREAIAYIRATPAVRDVILSGGDPLELSPSRLRRLLSGVRAIPHVEIVRIGSRVPCTDPARVTPELARMLSAFHPLYMNVHFNHPREVTPEAARALALLAGAGIPLSSQTVLLAGVNDDATVLRDLFLRLLAARVRPYYLLQMDLTRGTAHFRTPLATGLRVLSALRNHVSGLAVPHFVVDLPGGKGKVPLLPQSVAEISEGRAVFRTFGGEKCAYPLLPGEGEAFSGWLRGGGGA